MLEMSRVSLGHAIGRKRARERLPIRSPTIHSGQCMQCPVHWIQAGTVTVATQSAMKSGVPNPDQTPTLSAAKCSCTPSQMGQSSPDPHTFTPWIAPL